MWDSNCLHFNTSQRIWKIIGRKLREIKKGIRTSKQEINSIHFKWLFSNSNKAFNAIQGVVENKIYYLIIILIKYNKFYY